MFAPGATIGVCLRQRWMFSKLQYYQVIFQDTLARAGRRGSSSLALWSGPSDSTTLSPTSTPSTETPSTASIISLGLVNSELLIVDKIVHFWFSRGCNLLPGWPALTRSSEPRSRPQVAPAHDPTLTLSIKERLWGGKKVVSMEGNIILREPRHRYRDVFFSCWLYAGIEYSTGLTGGI